MNLLEETFFALGIFFTSIIVIILLITIICNLYKCYEDNRNLKLILTLKLLDEKILMEKIRKKDLSHIKINLDYFNNQLKIIKKNKKRGKRK